jgi:hypothetical protein
MNNKWMTAKIQVSRQVLRVQVWQVFFLLVAIFVSGCGVPCNQLPTTFSSYEEAMDAIEGASFSIEESVNTSKSSFINDADYYSCNGSDGYLVIQLKDQDYIYEGIPVSIWREFIDAESFGSFYVANIKGRYRFHLK